MITNFRSTSFESLQELSANYDSLQEIRDEATEFGSLRWLNTVVAGGMLTALVTEMEHGNITRVYTSGMFWMFVAAVGFAAFSWHSHRRLLRLGR